MHKLTFIFVFLALISAAAAQFTPIPNGDFSMPGGQQWRDDTSDASTVFPSTGGNPGGYGLIDSFGNGTGWGGVLVQEGGIGSFPASGDGLSLASLGMVAGETYTFQWDMKNFTPESTLPAGIKLESWREGLIVGSSLKFEATTGSWVTHTFDYTIDPEATALKVVLVNNQGFSGPSAIGFDNVGVVGTQPFYTLNISPVPINGLIEGSGVYLEGETATLTASPDPGYVFGNWTGEASGSENPLVLEMNQNKTVGAVFVLDPELPTLPSRLDPSVSIVDGVATISINSHSGYVYRLETSQSLESDWAPLNEVQIGNGTTLEFIVPASPEANRFYRIKRSDAMNVFGFADLTNAAPGSVVTSNSILISGLSAPAAISILNGEYSIDGGLSAMRMGRFRMARSSPFNRRPHRSFRQLWIRCFQSMA